MKTGPRVSVSLSVEKLSTLCEDEEHDLPKVTTDAQINTKPQQKHELNNNVNNNNRKVLLTTQASTTSVTSVDIPVFSDSKSTPPGTPISEPITPGSSSPSTLTRPQSVDGWVGVGTYRRRKISKERARSLRTENEELGLENVIPYHKSPKALANMGKSALLIHSPDLPQSFNYGN